MKSKNEKPFSRRLNIQVCKPPMLPYVLTQASPSSPLFVLVGHCFRGWWKVNLKVYGIINCLNKNLITHVFWYLEKKKKHDIEILSIDRILNEKYFHEKSCRKFALKAIPRSLFNFGKEPKPVIVLNNPNNPNSFKSKIFWKRIIENP